MRTDYYSVLQVERLASDGEIRKAFRRLVLTHHPDRNGNNPQSAESTILLYEAYATLSDPVKRVDYDRLLNEPPGRINTRRVVPVERTDPAAPEAIRCARCSRCDDTLRHSEFFMVVSLISFAKQSVEQPGVYCSGCRTALGSKWLLLSMLCGWWSFTGLIWTPKAIVRNVAGGLRRGHSQRALLRLLATRLIWQKQFSDAARVVRRLSYLDPEYAKLGELTAKVREGRRKPQQRSSFALHPRRLPTPLYALPIALFPFISAYVSVIIAGDLKSKQQTGLLSSPIAKFLNGAGVSPILSDNDADAMDQQTPGPQPTPSAAANYGGALTNSFSGKAGSGSVFPDVGRTTWSTVDDASRTQRHPEIDDQRATQAYFQQADVPDVSTASVADHKVAYVAHKAPRPPTQLAEPKIAPQTTPVPTSTTQGLSGAPAVPATIVQTDSAEKPPISPVDTVTSDPPASYDDSSPATDDTPPVASTPTVTSQPDAHALSTH